MRTCATVLLACAICVLAFGAQESAKPSPAELSELGDSLRVAVEDLGQQIEDCVTEIESSSEIDEADRELFQRSQEAWEVYVKADVVAASHHAAPGEELVAIARRSEMLFHERVAALEEFYCGAVKSTE